MDRFHRIRALLGDAAITRLHNATVMVVGCGAVGSFAIEALARSGVGHLILVDSDAVEPTNTNRQLFALTSTVGQKKVYVAAARVRDINPDAIVDAVDMFVDDKTMPDFMPDFVIDAIDTVPSKIALYKWCQSRDIPFVSSMGAALKTDPRQIRVSKISQTSVCPLAAKVRSLIRNTDIEDFTVVYSTEVPHKSAATGRVFGSIVTITGTFGLMLANMAIETIVQGD